MKKKKWPMIVAAIIVIIVIAAVAGGKDDEPKKVSSDGQAQETGSTETQVLPQLSVIIVISHVPQLCF